MQNAVETHAGCQRTETIQTKRKWEAICVQNTYTILAYVQLTLCSAVEMCRRFSKVENSKNIEYAESNAGIVDSANSRLSDSPYYSTWLASKMRGIDAVYYL